MRLRIDAGTDAGNVALAAVREEGGVAVASFTAHPHGGPETCWFRFRVVARHGAIGRLRLELAHFENLLGGGDAAAVRPVVRHAGGGWVRLPPGEPLPRPDGATWATWELDAPTTTIDVALCYPHGDADVDAVVDDSGGWWRADTIGVTQRGRPLRRLVNRHGGPGDGLPGIYLLARQHAGETPGSWVLDGFLRHCAQARVDDLVVWCVPLADADGVAAGDYGKDQFPIDLNRAWGRPPMRHETLVLQRDIGRWRRRCAPAFALDLHAPGVCEADGVYLYGHKPELLDGADRAAQIVWARSLQEAVGEDGADDFLRHVRYPCRWTSPSALEFLHAIPGVTAFVVEASYVASRRRVLTIDGYREIGSAIAGAVIGRLRAGR